MFWFLVIALVGTMMAIVAALFFGLVTLKRGDSPVRSQKLMQLRVGLQFLAVMLIALLLYIVR